jgi:gas vesicle protein
MTSILNDTIGTARGAMDSAKEGTEHAVSSARSTFLDGLRVVSGLIGVLRGLHLDDGLAWIGLARRSPLRDLAVFGAGFAVGAGAGLLFAPRSGADTRRAILDQLNGLKREAKETFDRAGSEVKEVGEKAEDLAGKAKDALKKAEQKVETKMAEGADVLKSTAEAAAHALKDRAEAIGDTLDKEVDEKSLN